MKNREAIQRVLSLYAVGIQSDDIGISNRHTYSVLKSNRSDLLTQKAKKRQIISAYSYQILPCVQMIPAPAAECPNIENTNAYILKSKFPIPETLVSMDKHLITVTSLDGSVVYNTTGYKSKSYGGGKYTKASPAAYLSPNGHLYITNTLSLDAVTIIGVFKDPILASTFPSFCNPNTDCIPYLDYELPIDGDIERVLVLMSAEELINNFKKGQRDFQNNSKDDTVKG